MGKNTDWIGIFSALVLVVILAGIVWYVISDYDRRKAQCKAEGGQWLEAFQYMDSKCLGRPGG